MQASCHLVLIIARMDAQNNIPTWGNKGSWWNKTWNKYEQLYVPLQQADDAVTPGQEARKDMNWQEKADLS